MLTTLIVGSVFAAFADPRSPATTFADSTALLALGWFVRVVDAYVDDLGAGSDPDGAARTLATGDQARHRRAVEVDDLSLRRPGS